MYCHDNCHDKYLKCKNNKPNIILSIGYIEQVSEMQRIVHGCIVVYMVHTSTNSLMSESVNSFPLLHLNNVRYQHKITQSVCSQNSPPLNSVRLTTKKRIHFLFDSIAHQETVDLGTSGYRDKISESGKYYSIFIIRP